MTAPQCMTRPDVKPDATMRSNSLASVRAAPVHVRIRRITTEKNLFIRSPIDCDEDKKESKVLLKVFLDLHLGFAIIIRTRFSGALFCSLLWGFPLFRQLRRGKNWLGFFRKIMLILQNCTNISTLAHSRTVFCQIAWQGKIIVVTVLFTFWTSTPR